MWSIRTLSMPVAASAAQNHRPRASPDERRADALGRPYVDPNAQAGQAVRAAHINELQAAVVALENAKPDLVAENPAVSPSGILRPRQPVILSVTIRNRGSAPARRTTIRYFWSTNSTITWDDTRLGFDDSLPALAAGAASEASTTLLAQVYTSTLYVGACIDPVPGEDNTENNCSPGVQVTVYRYAGATAADSAGPRSAEGP